MLGAEVLNVRPGESWTLTYRNLIEAILLPEKAVGSPTLGLSVFCAANWVCAIGLLEICPSPIRRKIEVTNLQVRLNLFQGSQLPFDHCLERVLWVNWGSGKGRWKMLVWRSKLFPELSISGLFSQRLHQGHLRMPD